MSEQRLAELRGRGKLYFIESYAKFLRYGPDALHTKNLEKVTPEMLGPIIKRYFASIENTFSSYAARHAGKRYDIGMYCTGVMCAYGRDNKLAVYFWLSPEGRYDDPDYRRIVQNDADWNLQQQLPTACSGWTAAPPQKQVSFEFDRVNALRPNFGQWSSKRPVP